MSAQITERPANWSKRANAPYYRERYALEIKHVLDEMILAYSSGDKESRIIRYSEYPEISATTLYLKINQSLLYLTEKLDTPDKLYATFRQIIEFSRLRSIGIKISYQAGSDDKPLSAYKVSAPEIPQEHPKDAAKLIAPPEEKKEKPKALTTVNWKEELNSFVDKAEPGQTLKLHGLTLTMEDGEYIKGMVPDDKCIIYKVTVDSLLALKLTADEYAKAK